ncbi:MAG: thiamine pyrophosphate-binding protein, partial [Acidimicrobiales bacterium]
MNGAQLLMSVLASEGVEVCFANPGTSELHLVEAIDSVEGMRGVLVLFEGVATGAADGYGRMTDRPAAVLLHLGPGLSNGLANLHNARRAGSPVVCIVGDQATFHQGFDPPLTMRCGIAELASSVSGNVMTPVVPDMVESMARNVVAWTVTGYTDPISIATAEGIEVPGGAEGNCADELSTSRGLLQAGDQEDEQAGDQGDGMAKPAGELFPSNRLYLGGG